MLEAVMLCHGLITHKYSLIMLVKKSQFTSSTLLYLNVKLLFISQLWLYMACDISIPVLV